ncbi:MAG: nuclear transport factor 2 family protein [Defluviitaleaceae bacterium]|nr:nuclear transport factor 2 family protein [Defluviitaleaceae bacterium]
MENREIVIKNCFNAWIEKDVSIFADSFAESAVYIESWGPAYRGRADIIAWFADWTRENCVLEWRVKTFFHAEAVCICEWYFECECGGEIDGFNGVSIVNFNADEKIISLREFQSKTPNVFPYELRQARNTHHERGERSPHRRENVSVATHSPKTGDSLCL